MNTAKQIAQARELAEDQDGKELQDGTEVDVETVDAIVFPRLLTSHMVVARAETMMLGRALDTSVQIQLGDSNGGCASDGIDDAEFMRTLALGLSNAIQVFSLPDLIGFHSVSGLQSSGMESDVISATAGAGGSVTGGAVQPSASQESQTPGGVSPQSIDSAKMSDASSASTATTAAPVKLQENIDLMLCRDATEPYQHLVEVATGDRELVSAACSVTLKVGQARKRALSRTQSTLKAGNTNKATAAPPAHASVRAEVMLLAEHKQGTEYRQWIQWAQAVTHGMGLGVLGLPGTVDADDKAGTCPFEQFREVRARLVDIEESIDSADTATKIVLYAALMKISVQLNLRKEAGGYISQLELLCEQISDPNYKALVKRFRLDFEDWSSSFMDNKTTILKLKRLQTLLQLAKEYHKAAEITSDIQIQRDALKRVVNIFIEIYQQPEPSGQPATDIATVEEMESHSTDIMEEMESTDIEWMKRFSKLRSVEFAEKMMSKKPRPIPQFGESSGGGAPLMREPSMSGVSVDQFDQIYESYEKRLRSRSEALAALGDENEEELAREEQSSIGDLLSVGDSNSVLS